MGANNPTQRLAETAETAESVLNVKETNFIR
jgi:hypothetical protein